MQKEKLKYLEIYPSEVAAKKILRHLDKMLAEKPKVYKKTILRYKKLAELLMQCLSKINKFIESETLLSSDDTEFDELSKPAEDNIESFKKSTSINQISKSLEDFDGIHTSGQQYNSSTILQYSTVLQTSTNIDFGYEEINQCAKLVNMWFQARIPKNSKDSDFRYNINQLPLWISQIIITYGYYLEQGKVYDLEQEMLNWCSEIKDDPHNTYRVPYCVYNTCRPDKRECFTLSAVLISDILVEKCYYSLLDAVKYSGPDVVSIVRENNPSLTNAIRTRINNQEVLLETLEFTSTAEGGNNK